MYEYVYVCVVNIWIQTINYNIIDPAYTNSNTINQTIVK